MRARHWIFVAVVVALWLSLPAASATADDASLRAAGKSRDAQFTALGKKARRAFRAWRRADYSRRSGRKVIRVLRAARAEIRIVMRAVEREEPSTEGGATYKRLFFKSVRELAPGMRLDEAGVRAGSARKFRRMRAYFRRAEHAYRRSGAYERRAISAIEGSG